MKVYVRQLNYKNKKIIRLTSEIDSKEFTNERLIKLLERLQNSEKTSNWNPDDHKQNPEGTLSKIHVNNQEWNSELDMNEKILEVKDEESVNEFGNMSSIIYENLKNEQTNDYDNLQENILENIIEDYNSKGNFYCIFS